MSRCRSCGQSVIWARTEAGKIMPVDPQPHPAGNLILTSDTGEWRVWLDPDALGPKHRAHFVTCQDADQWRRAR